MENGLNNRGIAMYYLGSVIHIEKTIAPFDTSNYHICQRTKG